MSQGSTRGGTDEERRRKGEMTREEAGRKGGESRGSQTGSSSSASSTRGGTDEERERHGKMSREEAGRKGGEASHGGGRKKENE